MTQPHSCATPLCHSTSPRQWHNYRTKSCATRCATSCATHSIPTNSTITLL